MMRNSRRLVKENWESILEGILLSIFIILLAVDILLNSTCNPTKTDQALLLKLSLTFIGFVPVILKLILSLMYDIRVNFFWSLWLVPALLMVTTITAYTQKWLVVYERLTGCIPN